MGCEWGRTGVIIPFKQVHRLKSVKELSQGHMATERHSLDPDPLLKLNSELSTTAVLLQQEASHEKDREDLLFIKSGFAICRE